MTLSRERRRALEDGDREVRGRRREAFVLPLVLVIILALSTLAAVMMEIATDRFSIYSMASERDRLYNAAQTGIEWGKAKLWESRAFIDGEQKAYKGSLRDLAVTKTSGEEIAFSREVQTQSSGVTVEVTILDCNYELDESASYAEDLPPIFPASADVFTGALEVNSAIISPNRLAYLGGFAEGTHVFLIRSKATGENGKKLQAESVVVIER